MAAGTTLLCSSLLFAGVFVFVSTEKKTITPKPGQNANLTCRAPNNNIVVVKWIRADLGEKYVLLYQDGHIDSGNQHESFKKRVDLQDRQMKDGDVSVILKNVTISDTGIYECRVVQRVRGPFSTFSFIDLIVLPEQKPITAESGHCVTLPCRPPKNNHIRAVEWSRSDLEAKNVLLYQDGQFVPDNQHQSFKNRVDLQDRQMKDGDVSVILKDVRTEDDGTYVCRVRMEGAQSLKPVNITYLRVLPPGHSGGFMAEWIIALVLVLAGVLVGGCGVILYKKRKNERQIL